MFSSFFISNSKVIFGNFGAFHWMTKSAIRIFHYGLSVLDEILRNCLGVLKSCQWGTICQMPSSIGEIKTLTPRQSGLCVAFHYWMSIWHLKPRKLWGSFTISFQFHSFGSSQFTAISFRSLKTSWVILASLFWIVQQHGFSGWRCLGQFVRFSQRAR